MQIAFSEDHKQFAARVESFVCQHWPVGEVHISPAQRAAWHAAVVAAGWSVPAWPAAAGGTDWDVMQQFIWQQTCARYQVDQTFADGAGVAVVGPMLIAAGQTAAVDAFLPDIRHWRSRWCLAVCEPGCDAQIADMSTTVRSGDGCLTLNGEKSLVLELQEAHWIAVLARYTDQADTYVLVAVPAQHPALSVTRATSLDGVTEVARLTFNALQLPLQHLLTQPAPAQQYQHLLFGSAYATLARSAVAGAVLARIDAVLATLAEEADLNAKRNALAVDLAALQALEMRFVDALARGLSPPVPLDLMRLRSRQILMQLGALQIDCFGYYALPYPDAASGNPMLMHNEGPVGPVEAAGVMQHALAGQVAAFFEQDAGAGLTALKDRAAEHLNIASVATEEATAEAGDKHAGKTADNY
ncbi:MAG: acyl-CoA dehydrogenase family protein [bacterium]